jgi:glycerol kinase|tara:strand:- start:3003 stop:4487 length:1485 start_codon:yes stop_codon:yes gene_type:complete
MNYILAIDQGTSSSRAIVFDDVGNPVGEGSCSFDQMFPRDGWVEQDPEVIWNTTLKAAREAIASSPVEAAGIAAIGIANQRETTLLWDAESGQAVHNAIVWQDRRTAERCVQMQSDGMATTVNEVTGLVIDPYFSSTKVEWLLRDPEAQRLARSDRLRFGTVDTFLVWRFTGGRSHATDATNAARTQLFDITRHVWSDILLDYFGIPASLLPEVKDSVADYGRVEAQWFGAEIPIFGIAGDQQAALIGQGCISPGMVKSTYGTGCFVMANTGTKRVDSTTGLLTTIGYRVDGRTTFAMEGSIFSAGVAVKWLRDKLGFIENAAETSEIASKMGGNTNGVYVVPAFTGLGAPHWRSDARGVISGLTLDSGVNEIVTATLSSVAFQTMDLFNAFRSDGVEPQRVRIDGGMVQNDWFCQFLSDVTESVLERPMLTETTALGVGFLAAIGAGLINHLEDASRHWSFDRRFSPAMEDDDRSARVDGWRRAVSQALAIDP